ncbi:MAG: hypothetical protein AAFZ07_23650 [Actinomycetota bacterium]
MPGRRRPHLLPALFVALVTMTGCAVAERAAPADPSGAADARPAVGVLPGEPDADPPPPGSTSPSPAPEAAPFDRDAGYEAWLPIAMARLDERTAAEPPVPSEVVCEHVSLEDCVQLPAELPAAAVRMFDWMRETGELAAPNEVLRMTAGACLLLDEMSWEDMILLLAESAEWATDFSVIAYSGIGLFSPAAVVFVCPEHEAETREQMTALVCSTATEPDACDQFVDAWPTA